MSHLARQEIYGETGETADAMLAAIEEVTADDVYRLGQQFLAPGSLGVTVLGDVGGLKVTSEQLALG
jgi:predicted Zn-dependent peptidase